MCAISRSGDIWAAKRVFKTETSTHYRFFGELSIQSWVESPTCIRFFFFFYEYISAHYGTPVWSVSLREGFGFFHFYFKSLVSLPHKACLISSGDPRSRCLLKGGFGNNALAYQIQMLFTHFRNHWPFWPLSSSIMSLKSLRITHGSATRHGKGSIEGLALWDMRW